MNVRRPSGTRLLRGAAAAVVAIAAVAIAVRAAPQAAPSSSLNTSKTAWQLPRLGTSGELSLASLRGHPVVVDFFASWCYACQGELPGMATVSAQLKGKVTFVGVNSQETGDGMAMAQHYGIGWWPLAADRGGAEDSGLRDNLGAAVMPVTAFYDATGKLLDVVPGAISQADLKTRLHDLFGVAA
ncbi:MAG: TlpA disulfide reductase family protein [Candidatus Dormibacter sp.]